MTPIRTAFWPPAASGRGWWIAAAACIVAGLGTAAWLAAVTPPAFPFGDVAIIEITTAAALREPVMLGPYSQFGWHHPGPLMFYLLAPFYALAGSKSIGLAVGALVLNLLALGVIGRTLVQHAGLAAATTVTLVLGAYLLRGGELATSVWNPHLIVLPLVALVVLCAAVSCGDGAALVGATVVASFVAQTSVSVVPVALSVAAVAVGLGWKTGRVSSGSSGIDGRWFRWAALAGLVLWLLPLTEQITAPPGNMTRLLRFFVSEPSRGQSWHDAVMAWGDVTTALARPGFELPWGQAFERRGSWGTTAAAVTQLVLLVLVGVWARRRGARAYARLSLLTALTSVVACWSITRIVGAIGDYQIFWMSAVGALNLAIVAGAVAVRATEHAPVRRRRLVAVMGALLGLVAATTTVRGLAGARAYAVNQRDEQAPRRVVADATAEYLSREHVARPLFRMNATSWLQAAGVVLHIYRNHGEVAVEPSWVPVFGDALAPDGTEDVVLDIGGGCPEGRAIVARADGLCVFAGGRRP